MTKKLPLSAVRIDAGTQSRMTIDEAVVAEYADALKSGTNLPPLTVFHNGIAYFLADGFHRYFAHKRNGTVIIDAECEEGTESDARWFASGANALHGLRRTNADKRKAVEMALAERPQMANRAIAEHCHVSDMLVADVRATLKRQVQELAPEPMTSERRVGRDGKSYTPKTPKTPPPEPSAPTAPVPPPPVAVTNAPSVKRPSARPAAAVALPKDFTGREIPAWLLPIWQTRDDVCGIIAKVNEMRLSIEASHAAFKDDPKDASINHCFLRIGCGTLALLQKFEREARASLPHNVCPVCQGADGGCNACMDGFQTEEQYALVPDNMKC